MAILVIAEHNNAALAAATLNTVAAAKAIGGDIHVLVAGQNVAAVAEPPPRSRASPRCWSPTTPPTPTNCRKTLHR